MFFWLSILAQCLGGLGGGSNSAATMAIVSSMDQEDREQNIGLMEMSFGLGMLLGPMIGGFLYHYGDYKFPFYFFCKYLIFFDVLAAFSLLMSPYIQYILARSGIDKLQESQNKMQPELGRLFSKPRFLFGLLA